MSARPFCRKCLLSEYDPDGALETVNEMIAAMPPEQRAEEAEYARRLAFCRECGELSAGLCAKCGCYAELRAAKRSRHCPHEKHYW